MAQGRRARRASGPLIVTALLGAVGAGLFVGGALAARSRADAGPVPSPPPTGVTAPPAAPPASSTSSTTAPPSTTTTTAPDGSLSPAEVGEEVTVLQQRLTDLGYWLGAPDGTYGQLTRQAVMAFQKAEGLARDGVAGPATLAALDGADRVRPRATTGSHLEIDLSRQLLLVVEDGRTRFVLNTSTGNGETYAAPSGGTATAATPTGTFAVQREIDGVRRAPLGDLYRPKYFNGGIAIHGAGDIPAQPASHGCARLTNAAMDLLWATGAAALGTTVIVY